MSKKDKLSLEDNFANLGYLKSNHRDTLINFIYNRCESDIKIDSPETVINTLKRLNGSYAFICNKSEFDKLHSSLMRLTHNHTFFSLCKPTVVSLMATLITTILANHLIFASELVEGIENFLFDSSKTPIVELSDLLEMKYGLINLVQYKIFPIAMGETPVLLAGSSNSDMETDTDIAQLEAERLLSLPVKCSAISDMYNFLTKKGLSTISNSAEYIAGLKIEEIPPDEVTEVMAAATNPPQTEVSADTSLVPVDNTINKRVSFASVPSIDRIIRRGLSNNANNAQVKVIDETLENGVLRGKGYVLDGEVTSPLGSNAERPSQIPLSGSDLDKFALLEYLYMLRVMASCIQKRTSVNDSCNSITIKINSPFKTISVPKPNCVAKIQQQTSTPLTKQVQSVKPTNTKTVFQAVQPVQTQVVQAPKPMQQMALPKKQIEVHKVDNYQNMIDQRPRDMKPGNYMVRGPNAQNSIIPIVY